MRSTMLVLFAMALVGTINPKSTRAADRVAGNLIQFNDNGAWCWYQDPRLVVDPANNTLLISSIAAAEGNDGQARGGDVDISAYSFDTGMTNRTVLHHAFEPQDDHNAAAFLIRSDGRYLAMYSLHNHENLSYWRISSKPHDINEWGEEQTFDWTEAIKAAGAHSHVTYSNLFYLPAENRTYNFSRAINDDPSILISANQGEQWSYAGKLFTEEKLGYVNGYTKYASNGRDRIDFITTEHHPRDFNNSIYHGFIQGGKLHQSDGTVIDKDIFSSLGHSQTEFTTVFPANSMFDGTIMTHAWTIEVTVDSAGNPYALISARADDQPENTNFTDHRFFYCRYDGKQWQANELCKAGACLWQAEQDYTGLATLDPADPNTVYVSTTVDPRNGSGLKVHEIFEGHTADSGKTWAWTPITSDSTFDNLRPLAVNYKGSTVLVWFRGTMSRSQHYDAAMVGVLLDKNGSSKKEQYVQRTDANTRNVGDGFVMNEQTASGLAAGTYDVYVYFWAKPMEEAEVNTARIVGGPELPLRTRSSQTADSSQFTATVKVQDGERFLYRTYLGKKTLKSGESLAVDVEEEAGSVLDGIGYARAD